MQHGERDNGHAAKERSVERNQKKDRSKTLERVGGMGQRCHRPVLRCDPRGDWAAEHVEVDEIPDRRSVEPRFARLDPPRLPIENTDLCNERDRRQGDHVCGQGWMIGTSSTIPRPMSSNWKKECEQ